MKRFAAAAVVPVLAGLAQGQVSIVSASRSLSISGDATIVFGGMHVSLPPQQTSTTALGPWNQSLSESDPSGLQATAPMTSDVGPMGLSASGTARLGFPALGSMGVAHGTVLVTYDVAFSVASPTLYHIVATMSPGFEGVGGSETAEFDHGSQVVAFATGGSVGPRSFDLSGTLVPGQYRVNVSISWPNITEIDPHGAVLISSPYSLVMTLQCYANCDGSTAAPVLNVNDFLCFMQKYAAGDSYANCDGSTQAPVLNVSDFVCFQTRFVSGCG